ncbi:hypothetical protein [Pedobacter rhizosphaerae]|uniref:Uncharacterized protein n=1 Tax=Pedobacter rhizosphaerae TaxID=390241 RepID=A0A1H9W763_9SPHI|nr:hypothetical protein [Pedobacter rhizosphaerae]SES29621.1 hypothetical protein SAMN04488023_16015 [Pedobacter rhizosphaerae]
MKTSKLITLFSLLPFMAFTQTLTRNDAGLQGDAGATSGFFETNLPVNYPAGASSWWHLLDVRHSNSVNNFAMQFSGGFWDQQLYFRKTANNPSQAWSKVLTEFNNAVGIGTDAPENHEGWDKVLEIRGNGSSKTLVSTNSVISGIWSHEAGFYGAPAGGIVGTYTNHPFTIVTNQTAKLAVLANGNVGIGILNPNDKLAVNGNIRAREVKVESVNWPDYVFAPDYKIPSLAEVAKYIQENKHLPDMPSAQEASVNGISVSEMLRLQQQKIEELTLYLIEKDKTIDALIKRVEVLEDQKK